MPKKLSSMVIDKVALCGRGANQDSHIALFKSDDAPDDQGNQSPKDRLWSMVKSVFNDSNDNELNGGGGNVADTSKIEDAKSTEDVLKALPEEQRKLVEDQFSALNKSVTDLQKSVDELKNGDSGGDGDKTDINKSDLDPKVLAYLEKLEAQAKTDREQAAEASKIAKEEREARLAREFLSKADNYKAAGDVNQIADVLKWASQSNPEKYKTLEALLKAAAERAANSDAFEESGQDGGNTASGAEVELEKKALEIRKSDSKLTSEQAFTKAVEENPHLYDQYIEETS